MAHPYHHLSCVHDSSLLLYEELVSTVLLQGAACLARALRANSTLKDLDLRWNEVGNDGARAIRDSLDTNRSLTSVKLSGNKVGVGSVSLMELHQFLSNMTKHRNPKGIRLTFAMLRPFLPFRRCTISKLLEWRALESNMYADKKT